MKLPVYVYGCPVLRKVAENIDKDYPKLKEFLADMWETMYYADGVGLAAPQVGKSVRVIVIDGNAFAENDPSMEGFKVTLINAKMISQEGEEWAFQEGCLSVPGIHEDVYRPSKIRIQYYDENWQFHDEEFDGKKARIIQHEYDHLEGNLFVDKIPFLRKRLLNGKLNAISKGKAEAAYKIKLPK